MVPLKKKNGQIQVYIYFWDLSKACPKDFHVPHMKMLINVTTGYEALSFMDGYMGYNKIKNARRRGKIDGVLLLSHPI